MPPSGSRRRPAGLRPSTARAGRGLVRQSAFRESHRVRVEALRWRLAHGTLGFSSTRDLEPLDRVYAQERALEAIRLGVDLDGPGFNVFCMGLGGTQRLEVVAGAVQQMRTRCRPSPDRCYVMNFKAPDSPRLLELPRGTVRHFKRDIDDLSDQLVKHLGLVFEEERFASRVRQITEHHQRREREIMGKLHDAAREAGFAVSQSTDDSGVSVDLAYRLENHLFSMTDLEQAVEATRAGTAPSLLEASEEDEALIPILKKLDIRRISATYRDLSEMLRKAMVEARRMAASFQRQVTAVERAEALVVVGGVVQELGSRYAHVPGVLAHLEDLKVDVLDHLVLFKRPPKAQASGGGGGARSDDQDADEDVLLPPGWTDIHWRYRVNIVLDNRERGECPVLVESNPTPRNLFGAIVRVMDRAGRLVADHRSVRPGSLLAADGGYLILDAADLVVEPESYRMLKRALVTRSLDLRDAGVDKSQPPGPLLKPDPIALDVKVVLVGDESVYHFLDEADQDFRDVFKIRAEFEWIMDRTPDNVRALARSLKGLVISEKLPEFSSAAVAALAEHSARLAEQADKMISRFHLLHDVARQAAFFARESGEQVVGARDVARALAAAERRCSLESEQVREAIQARRIMLHTKGLEVGQINGLAVRETTDHAFGYPVRITAAVGHGASGVVNIEREARLAGSLHAKGMMIVEGYVQERYGAVTPLAFSASVAFEQSYGEIDGDSASAAEIYTLLSALTAIPLDQGVAVTGSVNQVGEIQPIGGVNEKIEGFFDACASLAGGVDRLDGAQGVVIPESNVGDLMLRPDVVAAVGEGRFHVWAVRTVEEGLELLTGRPAGTRDAKGRYPDGSLHAAAVERLRALWRSGHGGARDASETGRGRRPRAT